MKQKWIRWAVWILLTPILLFIILMALLYVPAIQNFLRQEATAYASNATGMDIRIGRIDLRFPLNLLVSDVEVIQQSDTLLSLNSLNVHVQALPLLRGHYNRHKWHIAGLFLFGWLPNRRVHLSPPLGRCGKTQ